MARQSADDRFKVLRRSGWKGPIDQHGNAVMTETDSKGKRCRSLRR